jgi:hypothetical protein
MSQSNSFVRGARRAPAFALLLAAATFGAAAAQPTPPAEPEAPVDETPVDPPTTPDGPGGPPIPDAPEAPAASETGILRLHVISTRNTYVPMSFDVFDTSSQTVVASGKGADEAVGQLAPQYDLPPGIYKIVRGGEAFHTNVDYATVQIVGGQELDYVIVVDPETLQFRGSGVVSGQLPTGTKIAGVRIALNAGGTLNLIHRENVVGGTSGVSWLAGLFGNFSMVYDRGSHFVSVTSDLALTLNDPAVASVASTQDRWDAAALYAFNLGNPYLGPYARASFSTRVFPGYLYLQEENRDTVTVNIQRLDGTIETRTFGDDASQDDLRIKVAEPFAPIILQEEIGGNLKAVSLDLLLLQLTVATRLGFGFRQGFVNELLVVRGDDKGTPVNLVEVDDYSTLGPVIGANGTVTFARWLFGAASFGMMVPLKDTDDAGRDFGRRLLIDLSGTAGLKLPPITNFLFASFDYSMRLQRDGYISRRTQFDQTIMARVNLSLF